MFATKRSLLESRYWLSSIFFSAIAALLIVLCLHSIVIATCIKNADSLYLPSLFEDIYKYFWSIKGWKLPPAGYYFPDMFIYGLARLVYHDFRPAVVLAGFLQTFLFLTGGNLLYRQMGGQRNLSFLMSLLLVLGVLLSVMRGISGVNSQVDSNTTIIWWLGCIVSTTIHFGAITSMIWAVGLLMMQLHQQRKRTLGLFALLTLACSLSDSLFVVWFVVPAILAILFFGLTLPIKQRRLLTPCAAVLVAVAILAIAVQRRYNSVLNINYTAYLSWEKSWFSSYQMLKFFGKSLWFGDIFSQICYTLILSFSITCLLLAVSHFFTKRTQVPHQQPWRMLIIYIAGLASLSTFVATGLLNLFSVPACLRYMTTLLFLPLVCLIGWMANSIDSLLEWIINTRLAKHVALQRWPVALSLTVVVYFFGTGGFQHRQLTRPHALACLPTTEAAGLADYWNARPLTLFSQGRLQLSPITPYGTFVNWIYNRIWFVHALKSPETMPKYSFIFMENLDHQAIEQRFGKPDRRQPCQTSEVWFYNDTTKLTTSINSLYQQQFQDDISFLSVN